jgi:4-hydroxybutyryl-CoA dehydratase / vinylacetyl-CoA-Delta-isomerase
MKTADDYLASLRDGRRVFVKGRRVDDVTAEPGLKEAAAWIAEGYSRFWSGDPDAHSPVYDFPRSPEDLRARVGVVADGDVTVGLAGAALALLTAAEALAQANPDYATRARAFFEHCRDNDLRLAELITDAKGNRALSPSKQDDPDLYLRVVDRDAGGIYITGAKFHISAGPLVHELLVMPTKRMRPGEEEYAVACAVPANAPGVTMIATTYQPQGDDVRHYPVSARYTMPDAIVIFDRVHVPWDRVFLDGEVEHSAVLAHSLGLWERLAGCADMAHHGDLLAGAAQLIAEANGVDKITHIKDKIAEMAIYATIVRAGLEAAITNGSKTADGMLYPSELYTNAAKYYAASQFVVMVRNLHDIAGGTVITAPTMADFDAEELHGYLSKYLRTKEGTDARYRLRLFHAIRDFSADSLGGWYMLSWLQSGGGLFAQRTVTAKHYDIEHAKSEFLALYEERAPEAGEAS